MEICPPKLGQTGTASSSWTQGLAIPKQKSTFVITKQVKSFQTLQYQAWHNLSGMKQNPVDFTES